MRRLKTSLVILTLLAVVAAAGAANGATVLIPADSNLSTFKNVVTGKPTQSLLTVPIDCELYGFSGEIPGYTVVAIYKGSPSQQVTVYSNDPISPGNQLILYEIGTCGGGYKVLDALIDGAPSHAQEAATWDCLAFVPDDQTPSTFKNVVSGKPTPSIVDPPDALETDWGFVGAQMGHTVHAIAEQGKPGEFTLYTDFTILPGDNLEMIEIGAVEGYKVYYVIVTE